MSYALQLLLNNDERKKTKRTYLNGEIVRTKEITTKKKGEK